MAEVTKIDAFVQSSPHPAWLATSGGECLYVNQALERLIGLKTDEINQVDWLSFVVAEDRGAASESWQRSLTFGTPYRATVRLRGFDGVPATVELIAFGHELNDGTEFWLFTCLYVHGATQQYPGLEAQLQATLNVIPAYTWYALPTGGLTFVNERTADSLGLPKSHPLRLGIDTGAPWDAHIPLLHPDDQEEARRVWSVCLRTGSAGENSQRVCNAEGEYRWFLSRAEPLRASDGTLLYWIGVNLDIHERKQAELALQRNEHYLAEGQRLAGMGSWVLDPAGFFSYWSRELLRIHGLNPACEAPPLEEYLTLIHPQDREFMKSLTKQMVAEGLGCDVTKRIVKPDGGVRYVRCVGTPVVEGGTLQRIVGNTVDVTEHELLTRELQRREAYLAEAQKLSHTGSFGWKPGSAEIVFSEETHRIYEYDPAEQITLDKILERVHPDDRALVLATAERAASSGTAIDFTHRLHFADDRVKYLHVLAKPLRSTHDEIEFAGAVIDITAAKRTEETIRKSERELRTMFEIIPAHVGVTRPDGAVDFVSQSWLDYTGLTREQAMGWGWADAIHPEDRDRELANWRAALTSGQPLEQEVRARNVDGTYRWFLNRNIPLRDEDGNVVKWYGILFDIDERKRAEDHLRETRMKLATALKIATVAELSASIAHELNQPLMAVLGNAQAAIRWLAANPPDLAEATASLERVLRDIRTADTTMQHIRALFKREPYEKSDEGVLDIIRESLRFVRENPNKRNVEIVWSIEDSLPLICVDRIQTQQVFINLISNAIEATDGNKNTAKILLSAFATPEHEVVVQVIDNGTGLEDTERIFDAFMTTKEKGLGIGLAVSKTIVEAHGGRLWAENNPAGGATFNVALPIASKGGSNSFELKEPHS